MGESDQMIYLVFRKANEKQFSIENVFQPIAGRISGLTRAMTWTLPFSNRGLVHKVKNILAVFQLNGFVHITGDVYYTCLLLRRPFVATYHDVEILTRTSGLKRWLIKMFWFKIPSKKARFLSFVSAFSKQDFVEKIGGHIESKCTVIYNPLPAGFEHVPKEFNSQKPKILQIGTKQNKNLSRLAGALQGISCELIVVGKLTANQKDVLGSARIEYIERHNLTPNQLIQAYRDCDILSFVSTIEGFGLPIIEAQATGRVVITSKVTSMPEIAGRGAHLVDPFDLDDIRNGFLKLMNDESYRNQLVEAGLKNIGRFELEKISLQYLELYKKAFVDH
ncbi:MAG: glycosyltransferase [Vicingaceae bacterium]